jgi:hypothetical protein
MPLLFYPHTEDVSASTLSDRIEILLEAALRYKAIILGAPAPSTSSALISAPGSPDEPKLRTAPKDLLVAFNWEEIAIAVRESRELPEALKEDRLKKADHLAKLAEIYEVLRGAKMAKLEAVRLALVGEANQLRGGSTANTA